MVNDLIWAGMVRRVLVSRVVDACTPSDEGHGNGRRSDRSGQRVLVSIFAFNGNWCRGLEVRVQRALVSRFAVDGNCVEVRDACTSSDEGHGNGRRSDRCIQRELVSRFMDVFTPSAMVDDDQGWCNGN